MVGMFLENTIALIKPSERQNELNSMMLRVESCFCFFISIWCYWIRHKCWQELSSSLTRSSAEEEYDVNLDIILSRSLSFSPTRFFFLLKKLFFPSPNVFYIKISFCSRAENWNENIAAICYIKFTSFMPADIDVRLKVNERLPIVVVAILRIHNGTFFFLTHCMLK